VEKREKDGDYETDRDREGRWRGGKCTSSVKNREEKKKK